jgi:hypothetical protein
MDFILNGVPTGTLANKLMACNFDAGCLRPYVGKDGRSYCTIMQDGKPTVMPTQNASTLRYEEWRLIDDAVLKAARARLNVVADLRAAGLVYSIPNGMAKTVFSTEAMSDPGVATISMDAIRRTQNDRPLYEMTNMPLPIIHSGFGLSARQIAVSRQGGNPLDLSMIEGCGRRVAEEVEKLALGVAGTFTFGGGSLYCLTNFTYRNKVVVTAPTAVGWTGETFLDEILDMRQASYDDFHYGPFMVYTSPNWDQYLDADFKAASDKTIRSRVLELANIQGIKTADYLTGWNIVMVQMSTDTARIIVGLEVTTVQWEEMGGLSNQFEVMCIIVPQMRADYNNRCGIVHGNTA